MVIVLLIIIIATINTLNFTLAISPMWVRDTNTRIVLGATRSSIRLRLVGEITIITVVTCLLALAVCQVIPDTESLNSLFDGDIALSAHPGIVIAMLVIAAGIGIVSALAGKFNWFDFGAAFMAPNENPYIYVVTFFIGFVAAVACLLPGISGSMVLFIFGLYNPVIALYSGPDSMIHNHERIGTGIILTLILFVGVVVGLIAFAKIMHNLMEKHHQGTFTAVFGLILGSFVSMFINKDTLPYYEGGNPWWHYVLGVALLICGCVLMLFLVKKKMSAQKAAEETNAEDSGTN